MTPNYSINRMLHLASRRAIFSKESTGPKIDQPV